MRDRGFFITFEGIDASGKGTQIQKLHRVLTDDYYVLTTHEPGGTILGGHLRTILLQEKQSLAPHAELLLLLADRAQHVDHVLKPALDHGMVVLCDRYCDSTTAYQQFGRGLDGDVTGYGNSIACQGVMPNLTFVLEIPYEIAQQRQAERGNPTDRFELLGKEFFARVAAGYRSLNVERVMFLDGTANVDVLAATVKEVVLAKLAKQLVRYPKSLLKNKIATIEGGNE